MPLDADLTTRMTERDFWPLYLFDDEALEAYDEVREDGEAGEEVFRTMFWLDRGLGLKLEFQPGLGYVELSILAPESARAETVGWDDQAHFHPHVMPWWELDLLCRAAALHDAALRHPGPMPALLLRFAFLAEDESLDAITPLVDAAFAAVRPTEPDGGASPAARGAAGVREETRDWFDLRDLRGTGIEWTTGPDECRAVTQRHRDAMPLYSLREPDSQDFPFAAWSRLLARARELLDAVRTDPALHTPEVRAVLARCTGPDGQRHLGALASALSRAGFGHTALLRAVSEPVIRAEAAWAVETLAGLTQGEVVAAWFGAGPLTGSRSWRLSLSLPVAGRPWRFGQEFAGELSAALQEGGLGWAEAGGGTSVRDEQGTYVHHLEHLDVLIRDDLQSGVRVIAQMLRHHGAAETAVLKHGAKPYERIPLTEPPEPGPVDHC